VRSLLIPIIQNSPAMHQQSNQSQFMFLLHQPHNGGSGPTPEQLRHIMARFDEWMSGLRAKGLVIGTSGLDVAGTVLRGPRGASVTDGPYLESKEIVGGYVIIKADGLSHAIELARDCPGLDYQLTVEVRPLRARLEP
jgi:hypothetical protein